MFCYIIFFLDIFGMNIWIQAGSQWNGLAEMDPFIKLPFLLSLSSQYGVAKHDFSSPTLLTQGEWEAAPPLGWCCPRLTRPCQLKCVRSWCWIWAWLLYHGPRRWPKLEVGQEGAHDVSRCFWWCCAWRSAPLCYAHAPAIFPFRAGGESSQSRIWGTFVLCSHLKLPLNLPDYEHS